MKSITFLVATDPALYGPEAGPQDAQEYASFAYQYLQRQGYEEVEIEFVGQYPKGAVDTQAELRNRVWSAYRGR